MEKKLESLLKELSDEVVAKRLAGVLKQMSGGEVISEEEMENHVYRLQKELAEEVREKVGKEDVYSVKEFAEYLMAQL